MSKRTLIALILYKHLYLVVFDVFFVHRFELLLPKEWKGSAKPLYIHMAGTGDHVSVK